MRKNDFQFSCTDHWSKVKIVLLQPNTHEQKSLLFHIKQVKVTFCNQSPDLPKLEFFYEVVKNNNSKQNR